MASFSEKIFSKPAKTRVEGKAILGIIRSIVFCLNLPWRANTCFTIIALTSDHVAKKNLQTQHPPLPEAKAILPGALASATGSLRMKKVGSLNASYPAIFISLS